MINLKYLLFLIILCKTVTSLLVETTEIESIGNCGKFDVCNIVYSPYWGINAVEKLCLCPKNTFCPATFGNDSMSLLINTRTQMKFCSPIQELFSELPECKDGKEALEIQKIYYIDQVKNLTTRILCECNKHPVYWKHHSRVGQAVSENENEKLFKAFDYFECADLRKCNTGDFCGLTRIDYGFTFQRCTCGSNDDCRYFVEETDIEDNVEELFYNELFYKAYCLRRDAVNDW